MNIFITGASGFLGKSLAKKLIHDGHTIRLLARDKNNVQDLETLGAEVILGNLEKFDNKFLKNIDFVYHLAAIRYEWGFSWDDYYKTNILGTKNLLEASFENNVKKFIYCSSVFVFGYPEKLPVDESYPYDPTTFYSRSKMEAEKVVKEYYSKINTVIIRPTIVYGPGDTAGMFLKLCRLINKHMFVILGNGENYLHLTHIDDVVQGFIRAAEKDKNGDYIICSDKPIKLKELTSIVSLILNKKIIPLKIPVSFAKFIGFIFENIYSIFSMKKKEPLVTRSKVDILTKNQFFSSEKARKKLGYISQKNCSEEIGIVIDWYKKNGYL